MRCRRVGMNWIAIFLPSSMWRHGQSGLTGAKSTQHRIQAEKRWLRTPFGRQLMGYNRTVLTSFWFGLDSNLIVILHVAALAEIAAFCANWTRDNRVAPAMPDMPMCCTSTYTIHPQTFATNFRSNEQFVRAQQQIVAVGGGCGRQKQPGAAK